MAEDLQRVNPLTHLERIAEEFESRPRSATPQPAQDMVASQNEQAYAALGMRMSQVQGAPGRKPRK